MVDKNLSVLFPEPDFFKPPKTEQHIVRKSEKHGAAYRAFIRWSATPKPLREPKLMKDFEKQWKLPNRYCSSNFIVRADFHEKKMAAFWNWMFDKAPEVVYAIYRRAITNSTADAKIYIDLISKRLETQKPMPRIQPFMLVGVPQEKIDALFVPEALDGELVNEK